MRPHCSISHNIIITLQSTIFFLWHSNYLKIKIKLNCLVLSDWFLSKNVKCKFNSPWLFLQLNGFYKALIVECQLRSNTLSDPFFLGRWNITARSKRTTYHFRRTAEALHLCFLFGYWRKERLPCNVETPYGIKELRLIFLLVPWRE